MGFFDSFWVYIYMYISKHSIFGVIKFDSIWPPTLFAYRSHMLTCRVNPMCLLLWCGKRLRQFASSPFHQRLSNHPSGIVLKTLADDEANDCRWLDESWWVNQSIIQFFVIRTRILYDSMIFHQNSPKKTLQIYCGHPPFPHDVPCPHIMLGTFPNAIFTSRGWDRNATARRRHLAMKWDPVLFKLQIISQIWRFPEMRVPPNHPC